MSQDGDASNEAGEGLDRKRGGLHRDVVLLRRQAQPGLEHGPAEWHLLAHQVPALHHAHTPRIAPLHPVLVVRIRGRDGVRRAQRLRCSPHTAVS